MSTNSQSLTKKEAKEDHHPHTPQDAKECTRQIHDRLRVLRLIDSVNNAQAHDNHPNKKRVKECGFWSYVFVETMSYLRYLVKCWTAAFKRILFGGSLHPAELFPVLVFPIISGGILFLLLLYCIYDRIPQGIIKTLLSFNRSKHASHLFRKIDSRQVDAAKQALSKPMEKCSTNENERVFDLDIAKLLCQLSALMYSHNNTMSSDFVEKHQSALDPVTRGRKKEKKKHLRFNLDALPAGASATFSGIAAPLEAPAQFFAEALGHSVDAAKKLTDDFAHDEQEHHHDSEIIQFCRNFGIEYAPISELNSSSAAYASIFWDPMSNWIIVAFKGTGPTDFTEWMTDLDYNLVYGGSWLKGFGRIHGGFAERIFPRDVKDIGGRRPYDTIAAAVKIVAEKLAPHSTGKEKKANVYFTGHSLGTAIASLAYARAVSGKHDFGKDAVVRDAYLFATPIICDVQSVHAFNFTMFRDLQKPRTMWRITNRNDVVAALLPEQGDRPAVTNPNNLFTFAHLGSLSCSGLGAYVPTSARPPSTCARLTHHLLLVSIQTQKQPPAMPQNRGQGAKPTEGPVGNPRVNEHQARDMVSGHGGAGANHSKALSVCQRQPINTVTTTYPND